MTRTAAELLAAEQKRKQRVLKNKLLTPDDKKRLARNNYYWSPPPRDPRQQSVLAMFKAVAKPRVIGVAVNIKKKIEKTGSFESISAQGASNTGTSVKQEADSTSTTSIVDSSKDYDHDFHQGDPVEIKVKAEPESETT